MNFIGTQSIVRMLGSGEFFIKCVQEDYNLYSKSSPSVTGSVRIVKFNEGLSTGQGDPFGCLRVKEMALFQVSGFFV